MSKFRGPIVAALRDAYLSGDRERECLTNREIADAVRGDTTGRPTEAEGLCLSPLFVEWMMGLPIGFSDPESTDCARSGTR